MVTISNFENDYFVDFDRMAHSAGIDVDVKDFSQQAVRDSFFL